MLNATEHSACLGQTYRFAGEQRALGNQFSMVVVQVIQNRLPTDHFRQLRRQELGKRFNLQKGASALIEFNPTLLPDPALGVVSVRPKLGRSRRKIRFADGPVKGGLTDYFAERIGVEGNIQSVQRISLLFHPEGVV